jgi:glycosyltransferase involved in cell wall biosynthesis
VGTLLVSIIMSTRNHGAYISRSIESVMAQSLQDFELIIVNDNSTDDTDSVVTSWLARDRRIVYLKNETSLSVAQTFNKAMAFARGKYIARLDSDDAWIGTDKLKRQVNFLETHPDHVAVGGGMVVVDPAGRELFRYLKAETDDVIRAHALVTNPVANSTSVCRTDAVRAIGLCNEAMEYNEDWDFWLRMGRLGKLRNLPDYLSYYTMTGRNKSMVHLHQHTYAAIRVIWRFRKDYPNFTRGALVNSAQLCYALIPFPIRVSINPFFSQVKKKLGGSPAKAVEPKL